MPLPESFTCWGEKMDEGLSYVVRASIMIIIFMQHLREKLDFP